MRLLPLAALRAPLVSLLLLLVLPSHAPAQARIGDLTVHQGDVPRRLVGYGLVVGLDGTGDYSFGYSTSATPTVRSVVNLLRRFDIEVPPERLRMRDVAAVLVTADISPYLHAGGRFDVQVAAVGEATSLKGGVLWMTPLVPAPGEPALATAQGALVVTAEGNGRTFAARANSARIPQGGVMEVEPSPVEPGPLRLLLRQPDLGTATGIAGVINAAFGAGTATADDPGAVSLKPVANQAGGINLFLAAVDTLAVVTREPARIVIDAREGTVVAGGGVRIGPAVVSHHGLTLRIGGGTIPGGGSAPPAGLVQVGERASVQDVAAGLHAAGARPAEIAAIFESLQAAGALDARVVVR